MVTYPINYFKLSFAIFSGVFLALIATGLITYMVITYEMNSAAEDMRLYMKQQTEKRAKEDREKQVRRQALEAQRQSQLQEESALRKREAAKRENKRRARKSAQESCNYWTMQYQEKGGSYNKNWRDIACERARKL